MPGQGVEGFGAVRLQDIEFRPEVYAKPNVHPAHRSWLFAFVKCLRLFT